MCCVCSMCYRLKETTAAGTAPHIVPTGQRLWGRADLGGEADREAELGVTAQR